MPFPASEGQAGYPALDCTQYQQVLGLKPQQQDYDAVDCDKYQSLHQVIPGSCRAKECAHSQDDSPSHQTGDDRLQETQSERMNPEQEPDLRDSYLPEATYFSFVQE